MGFPQARMFDLHGCFTPAPPPAPPVPAPVPIPITVPCAPTVLVGKLPAARLSDMTNIPFPHPIVKGSTSVLIQKLPAARMTDLCACGGMIIKGEFTVLTGG